MYTFDNFIVIISLINVDIKFSHRFSYHIRCKYLYSQTVSVNSIPKAEIVCKYEFTAGFENSQHFLDGKLLMGNMLNDRNACHYVKSAIKSRNIEDRTIVGMDSLGF